MPGPETSKVARCRGCGAPIVWAKGTEGGAIPLDPRAIVYDVVEETDGTLRARKVQRALRGDMKNGHAVSHFATCPKANEFSRSAPKVPRGTTSREDGNGMGREP